MICIGLCHISILKTLLALGKLNKCFLLWIHTKSFSHTKNCICSRNFKIRIWTKCMFLSLNIIMDVQLTCMLKVSLSNSVHSTKIKIKLLFLRINALRPTVGVGILSQYWGLKTLLEFAEMTNNCKELRHVTTWMAIYEHRKSSLSWWLHYFSILEARKYLAYCSYASAVTAAMATSTGTVPYR